MFRFSANRVGCKFAAMFGRYRMAHLASALRLGPSAACQHPICFPIAVPRYSGLAIVFINCFEDAFA